MRVRCLHGFFLFNEVKVGEIADFSSRTGLALVPRGEAYTFAALGLAPRHSIKGAPFLGITATATIEGEPWEVFKANGFVYDFTTGFVRPIAATAIRTEVKQAGRRFYSPGLLLPGSITDAGRVQDFDGWFSRERLTWLYSEVSYV